MSCFPNTLSRDQILGDYTPKTAWQSDEFELEFNHLPSRKISMVLPKAKLIFLLRNPVDRLLSHYNHFEISKKRKKSPENFHKVVVNGMEWFKNCTKIYSLRTCVYGHHFKEKSIKPTDRVVLDNLFHNPRNLTIDLNAEELGKMPVDRTLIKNGYRPILYDNQSERRNYDWLFSAKEYMAIGIYHVHVSEWMKYFPNEQILVTKFEENIQDNVKFEHKILDFLGVNNKKE